MKGMVGNYYGVMFGIKRNSRIYCAKVNKDRKKEGLEPVQAYHWL